MNISQHVEKIYTNKWKTSKFGFLWRRNHAAQEMSPCTREEKWMHLVTANTIPESGKVLYGKTKYMVLLLCLFACLTDCLMF